VAIAYQYNIQTSDPSSLLPRVEQLKAAMEHEIHTIAAGPGVTIADAESRISAVIAQFQDLAVWLIVQRQESEAQTDPGATPAPATASPSPSDAASPAPSATPADAASPSPTPEPTAAASP